MDTVPLEASSARLSLPQRPAVPIASGSQTKRPQTLLNQATSNFPPLGQPSTKRDRGPHTKSKPVASGISATGTMGNGAMLAMKPIPSPTPLSHDAIHTGPVGPLGKVGQSQRTSANGPGAIGQNVMSSRDSWRRAQGSGAETLGESSRGGHGQLWRAGGHQISGNAAAGNPAVPATGLSRGRGGLARGAGQRGVGLGGGRGRGFASRPSAPHVVLEYPGSETEDIIMPPRPSSPEIAWKANTVPFTSAYQYTISHPDPRTTVPPHLATRPRAVPGGEWLIDMDEDEAPEQQKEVFGREIFASWVESAPAPKAKRAVKRVLRDLNTSLAKHFRGHQFLVEPFGSVSWGAETSEGGDLDLVLRDFAKPRGYTPDLWTTQSLDSRGLPSFYKVYALANALRVENYLDVEPIKWAATPIVKFKDTRSGIAIDLQTNDLGGWMNSQLLLAYARVSPYLLRPLIHVVKSWAKARQINDPSGSKGGSQSLSSYCWCLMCINYLQVVGKLPNLQAPDLAERAGRTGCDIYTNWTRPVGQRAEIAFAGGEGLEHLVSDEIPVNAASDLAEAVRGFFEFFAEAMAPEAEGKPINAHRDAFSVWKGGLMKRYAYKDSRAPTPKGWVETSKAEESATATEEVQLMQVDNANEAMDLDEKPMLAEDSMVGAGLLPVPPAAPLAQGKPEGPRVKLSRNEKLAIAAALPPEYFPELDGFCQPKKWLNKPFVVQDPLIHDKNCAGHIDAGMYAQLHEEFCRARQILSKKQPSLVELLQPAPPPKRRKEQQAEKRMAEAAQQAGGSSTVKPSTGQPDKQPAKRKKRGGKSQSAKVTAV